MPGNPNADWAGEVLFSGRTFLFGRIDGSVIGQVTLAPDGRFEGYQSQNERSWGIMHRMLVFFGDNDAPTTVFNEIDWSQPAVTLYGQFLPHGPGRFHVLVEQPMGEAATSKYIDRLRAFDFGAPPTPNVPQEPGYFPEGWYSDHPYLREAVQEIGAKLILDVGSFIGGSASRLATYARETSSGGDFLVVAIDTWQGSVEHYKERGLDPIFTHGRMLTTFLENMARAGVSDHVIAFPQTSTTAAKVLRKLGVMVDLVYLDASHEYDDVTHDLESYWPLVREGGLMIGDDYEEPHNDVIRAADDFSRRHSLPIVPKVAPATTGTGLVLPKQRKFVFRKPITSIP